MKRTIISGGLVALLWLFGSGQKASAQCSAQNTHFAYCTAPGDGNNYQQTYYITPGIPVNITDVFDIYGVGYASVEADIGCCTLWYDDSSTGMGGTLFTAAENTDGTLYLAAGASVDAYAQVQASW